MPHKPTPTEPTPHSIRMWNEGYHDGYNGLSFDTDMPPEYETAFKVGASDRLEDEEALASGELDILSESERQWLYGDELKASDFKETGNV